MARITVDDCLRIIPNRFDMSLAGTYAPGRLQRLATLLEANREKPTVIALRELAPGSTATRFSTQAQP